ncbi:hypothetical protein NEIRO03_2403, partial [Nematocida sp. AWRm78]
HEKQNINKESTEPDIEKESTKQNTNNRRNSLTKISKAAIGIVRRFSSGGSDLKPQKKSTANISTGEIEHQLVEKKLHLEVLNVVIQCEFHFNEIKGTLIGLVLSYNVFKENEVEAIKRNKSITLLLNQIIALINDVKKSFCKQKDCEILKKLTELDENYTDMLRAIQVAVFEPKISRTVEMCIKLIDNINAEKRSEESTKESINTKNIQEIINNEDTNKDAGNKANSKSANIEKVSAIVNDIITNEEKNLKGSLDALEIIYKEIRDLCDIQKAKDALIRNNNKKEIDIFAYICMHMSNNTDKVNDVVEKDHLDYPTSQSSDMFECSQKQPTHL